MEKSAQIALATSFAMVLGALFFILVGDGIEYFSSLVGSTSGSGLGASLVWTGYAIIAILVISFVLVVGYLIYRASQE